MIENDYFTVFYLSACITLGILIANVSAYGDKDRRD